jgi:histidinol-phosphatase (PHP family)
MTVERISRYVASGREHNVTAIAITEHLFRFREAFDLLHGWWEIDGEDPVLIKATAAYWSDHVSTTMAGYVQVVEAAKAQGLPVLLGIELDWIPGRAEDLARLIAPYDWDIILGSVHWIGAWGFDNTSDDIFWPEWRNREMDEVCDQYAAMLGELAASGLADVLAHPDLPKLAGHRPATFTPLHTAIVESARRGNCAVELNGNGRNKACAEPYPAPPVLEQARRAGLPITLASDAHRPEQVGWRFDELAAYAVNAGHDSFVSFDARRRMAHPLPTLS